MNAVDASRLSRRFPSAALRFPAISVGLVFLLSALLKALLKLRCDEHGIAQHMVASSEEVDREVKSNDVTGRYKRGEVGFGIEMGRPGTGTTFSQVQQLTTTLAAIGVEFEKKNPLTTLLSDPVSGHIREDILDERVLTAIIEFKVPVEQVGEVLAKLEKAQTTLDTVFSLDYIHRPNPDGSLPAVEAVQQLGYRLSDHVKICTGLGRPKID